VSRTPRPAYKTCSRKARASRLSPPTPTQSTQNILQQAERARQNMSWTTRVIPLLVAATSICFLSAAAASNSTSSHSHPGHHLLTRLSQWREHYLSDASSHAGGAGGVRRHTVLAWVLAFLAASVSSAGGVGGGSLFLPILNLVAGLTLKRATTYSSFMVTGGAASNVLYNLWRARGRPALIDYDIALLFQPCLLLGVSIGVVCNVMFPEWLITALFSLFLAFCTAKTCRAGAKIWRSESAGAGAPAAAARHDHKEPLLLGGLPQPAEDDGGQAARNGGSGAGVGFPWKDVAVLVVVWLCFFLLHVFIGDKHGKGSDQHKALRSGILACHRVPGALRRGFHSLYHIRKEEEAGCTSPRRWQGKFFCAHEDGELAGARAPAGRFRDRISERPLRHRRRAASQPRSPSDRDTPADCGGDVFVHGAVLRVHVDGPVHPAGHGRDRGGLGLRGDMLLRLDRRGGPDRAGRQEVRAGVDDRVPGHRHHGAQHRDRHLLRSPRCLDAVHRRSVHGVQAALLTDIRQYDSLYYMRI
uniref:Sulfite exporter TauE/SafE family protein n=1 Tax=Aegilops tauschii subsp. strangulata TaxID=200361 RepID=A0A453FPZ8_AEGTS